MLSFLCTHVHFNTTPDKILHMSFSNYNEDKAHSPPNQHIVDLWTLCIRQTIVLVYEEEEEEEMNYNI